MQKQLSSSKLYFIVMRNNSLLTRIEPVLRFRPKKTAVFGCHTNALAPPPIALESCSTAQTDRPV